MAKTSMVWARITNEERKLVEGLARAMNLNISEFIRYLIIQELDKRSIITARVEEFKKKIRGGAGGESLGRGVVKVTGQGGCEALR